MLAASSSSKALSSSFSSDPLQPVCLYTTEGCWFCKSACKCIWYLLKDMLAVLLLRPPSIPSSSFLRFIQGVHQNEASVLKRRFIFSLLEAGGTTGSLFFILWCFYVAGCRSCFLSFLFLSVSVFTLLHITIPTGKPAKWGMHYVASDAASVMSI